MCRDSERVFVGWVEINPTCGAGVVQNDGGRSFFAEAIGIAGTHAPRRRKCS